MANNPATLEWGVTGAKRAAIFCSAAASGALSGATEEPSSADAESREKRAVRVMRR